MLVKCYLKLSKENSSLLKKKLQGFNLEKIAFAFSIPNIQWLFLVPVKGGRWHIIPQLAVYTTYIPLIYCLLGGYMLPTTFYGNQKQPLKHIGTNPSWFMYGLFPTWKVKNGYMNKWKCRYIFPSHGASGKVFYKVLNGFNFQNPSPQVFLRNCLSTWPKPKKNA